MVFGVIVKNGVDCRLLGEGNLYYLVSFVLSLLSCNAVGGVVLEFFSELTVSRLHSLYAATSFLSRNPKAWLKLCLVFTQHRFVCRRYIW